MSSEIANNTLCHCSTVFLDILINRSRVHILQIYAKPILNLKQIMVIEINLFVISWLQDKI